MARGLFTGTPGPSLTRSPLLRATHDVVVDIALPDAATTTVTGTVAWTEGDDTVVASGSAKATGTAAWTEDDDVVVASGLTKATGTAAWTEGDDTVAGSGTGTVISGVDATFALVGIVRARPAFTVARRQRASLVGARRARPAFTVDSIL